MLSNACWEGCLPLLLYGNKAIREHTLWCVHMQSGSRADKLCLITQWMTHTVVTTVPAGSGSATCPAGSQKHCQNSHPACEPHHSLCTKPNSPSSYTPVKTIILHRTCAVAVNNTESAGGELVILLTLSLNHSLSLPSVTQCCLATVAEQFRWQQRPGLA